MQSDGDYEDTAKLILWLELHGLRGIQALLGTPFEGCVPPNLLSEDPFILDAGNANLLFCASVATDLAIAHAKNPDSIQSCSQVSIKNVAMPIAIVPCVARCAARNLATAAFWFDEASSALHLVQAKSGDCYPNYAIGAIDAMAAPKNQVELLCSCDEPMLSKRLSSLIDLESSFAPVLSNSGLRANFKASRDTGIEIDDQHYRALNDIADRILVEDSEESRRGAGE